jgi:predicted RNase H-like HicB family nuclease
MPKTVEEYLKEPYSRVLIPDEGGGYSAEILEFPGCYAEGESADEAVQALERAAESWIQAALDQGQDIPQPFVNQGYSGKVALRLPRSIHRKAVHFAERDGTSLNQFLVSAIAARVGAEECCRRLINQLTETVQKQVAEALRPIANITFVNHAITNTNIHVSINDLRGNLPLQNLRLDHAHRKATTGEAVGTVGGGIEWLK